MHRAGIRKERCIPWWTFPDLQPTKEARPRPNRRPSRNANRPSRRSTLSGSRADCPATATRFRSPAPRCRAWKTCVLGNIPGLPKVHIHNPVLAYEVGDELMQYWYDAEAGQARPLRARRRGLDSQRGDQAGGLLGGDGHRQADRPAHHDLRVDRPLGAEGLGGRRRRHLRDLRRHPRHGRQPDRLHGPGRLPGLGLALEGRRAHRQRAGLPGAAGQHDGDARSTCSTRPPGWRR